MIFRRQSTGSYMDYANGNPSTDYSISSSTTQNASNLGNTKEYATFTRDNNKERENTSQLQRKNSMTSRIRRSLSRSLSGDMSSIIKSNKVPSSSTWYTISDDENIAMTKTNIRDNKKYSDQSLNSQNSDEYYDEGEVQEDNEKEYNVSSSGEEDDRFPPVSTIATLDNDTTDGNFLSLKKAPTNRFFSRLVEATSSFSNSTPSLPSMIRRGAHKGATNNNNQFLSTKPQNNDVKLESMKLYLNENEVIVATNNEDNEYTRDKRNADSEICNCWNDDDEKFQNE